MNKASEAKKPEVKITLNTSRWPKTSLPDRLYYLESCRHNLRRIAPYWVEEEAALRGHSPHSEAGAESWLTGPYPVARAIRYLINGVGSGGRPQVPSRRLRIDGRSVSRVFPNGFHEGIIFYDVQSHVWSIGNQLQGAKYRRAREQSPGPALVLGASNVSSIPVTDTLGKMFCENRPVVCKIPPRFAPLEPIYRELFHPLIRDRHLQLICGGPDIGRALLDNPIFETVHLTGSVHTYSKILAENTVPHRTFTAELGCVTPLIVVPGPWTQKELNYQARHIASMLVMNGGYNCVTPQILLLSAGWSHKNAFLRALREMLDKHSSRDDKFPGAEERRKDFRRDYPSGECFGPRTLVQLSPDEDTRLFREESFCGMLGIVELSEPNDSAYLKSAAGFCNERLWGDLSCMILADDHTRRLHERAVANLLATLEYGTVSLNVYSGLAFVSGVTPWGSYLDRCTDTGNGWVNNPYFFDQPEKTVMEGTFIPLAPQPWVKPFPNLNKVGQAVFELDLDPNSKSMFKFLQAFGGSMMKGLRRVKPRP